MHPSNTSALPETSRQYLDSLLNDVVPLRDARIILLYGSHATLRNGPGSDLDIIAISANENVTRSVFPLRTISCDLYQSGLQDIYRVIQADRPDNHNFLLNALCQAQILRDNDGLGIKLIEDARDLWSLGPRRPSPIEASRLMAALKKSQNAAERASLKRADTELDKGLQILAATQLFSKALAGYCRISGLWMSNYSEMLTWVSQEYEPIKSWIAGFAMLRQPQEMFRYLDEMVSHAIELASPRSKI